MTDRLRFGPPWPPVRALIAAFVLVWLGWKVGEALASVEDAHRCRCHDDQPPPQERALPTGPTASAHSAPRKLGVVR